MRQSLTTRVEPSGCGVESEGAPRLSLLLQTGVVLWFALAVLVYRLRKLLAQRRVVEVSARGEPLAPLDERHAQDLLRLVVIGIGVQGVGFERRDTRAIRPRDRFECAGARPQLSPTRLNTRERWQQLCGAGASKQRERADVGGRVCPQRLTKSEAVCRLCRLWVRLWVGLALALI